ncbi:Putative TrmH family tRNA/rRNA methyltransferase [Caulifigura coniformis]|uniref:TrmH family tRNA/rRNA methyltransferase n=1 Tax=Caulifigura coniformis TaxID=2527983 RepID=A0A517SCG8_9PLAN|nr:23S rRNA (guanosine(2251)-2'-O)-methyltransferase RlmB [Caulifigura coniformis]QDT53822.1 Putative TrmH family tRNA/rRNA methyltransferase [Caulifigura coniformis]
MVGRRRKNPKTRLSGSHQRCWIWGRNAVLQTLASDRWRPLSLLVADRTEATFRAELERQAHEREVEIQWVHYDQLTDRCHSTEHQGLMAMMPEYPYSALEESLLPTGRPAFLMVLEGIQDPHNFGAIIRSAEVFGVDAIVVGESGQCDVTPHVARASAGAVNEVTIARVPNVVDAARWMRDRGVRLLGAAGAAERNLVETTLTASIALAIGNEGSGLSEAMLAVCDQLVRIPQVGRTESLNAAVAAGILCYEVRRQRSESSTACE